MFGSHDTTTEVLEIGFHIICFQIYNKRVLLWWHDITVDNKIKHKMEQVIKINLRKFVES